MNGQSLRRAQELTAGVNCGIAAVPGLSATDRATGAMVWPFRMALLEARNLPTSGTFDLCEALALQGMTYDPDIHTTVRFAEDAMGWSTKGGFNEESARLGVPWRGFVKWWLLLALLLWACSTMARRKEWDDGAGQQGRSGMRDTLPTVIARLPLPWCGCEVGRSCERGPRQRAAERAPRCASWLACRVGPGDSSSTGSREVFPTMATIRNRVAAMVAIQFLIPGLRVCRFDGGCSLPLFGERRCSRGRREGGPVAKAGAATGRWRLFP